MPMDLKAIKFEKNNHAEFSKILRKRVNEYFKSNNISRNANSTMIIKTISLLAIYLVPYFLMITGVVQNSYLIFICFGIMGVGLAGLGASVMHDANHGAYSKNAKTNNRIGKILDFLGGNAINWKIQHNVLHHSFTNIEGVDEDISPGGLLRFSPHSELKWFHKYQYIYAWILYGVMTLAWVTFKDVLQAFRYQKKNLLKGQGKTLKGLVTEIIISKVLYYAYLVAIPLYFMDISVLHFVGLFLMMHWIAGFCLALIFQPAHVMETAHYPLPDEDGHMENNWAVHQLVTTTNFAEKNPIVTWYVGGLNFQIEHHLYPNICHVHYPALSKIVRKTAEECGLPYQSQKTFRGAVLNHGKMLKFLGKVKPGEFVSPELAAAGTTAAAPSMVPA